MLTAKIEFLRRVLASLQQAERGEEGQGGVYIGGGALLVIVIVLLLILLL